MPNHWQSPLLMQEAHEVVHQRIDLQTGHSFLDLSYRKNTIVRLYYASGLVK